MNSIKLMCAAAMIAGAVGVPAFGQMANDSMMKKDSMSPKPGMKMSMADKKMMTKCNAMSHRMMTKNKTCMKMTKMHPDMMKKG